MKYFFNNTNNITNGLSINIQDEDLKQSHHRKILKRLHVLIINSSFINFLFYLPNRISEKKKRG